MPKLIQTEQKIAIGKRLKRARERMGWSQADACRELGVSTGKWSQWETGKSMPVIQEGIRLSDELKLSLDYLYRGLGGAILPTAAAPETVSDPNHTEPKQRRAKSAA